jgi:hypothetical protein
METLTGPRATALEEFWNLADAERMTAEYLVDRDLEYLRTAPPDILKKIFVQYRFFTIYYITDLALLVSRLPFGRLRSLLGRVLAEELGDGDPRRAHPRLYDDFLRALSIPEAEIEAPLAENVTLLEATRERLLARSVAYGIGLRGMGGECLCQVYLAAMFEHFRDNPCIVSLRDRLPWRFWDIHTGDEDIEHRELTRAAIADFVATSPEALDDLSDGYLYAKGAWDSFWNNIHRAARPLGAR